MKTAALIVTYNRLEKLKHTLDCYMKQSGYVDTLIVVDNHSTDDTYNYLEQWKSVEAPFHKYVIHNPENLGGSGGYYTGQKFALTLDVDWLFHADDDAYPEQDLFKKFANYCSSHNVDRLSAVCTSVCDVDGNFCYEHRAKIKVLPDNITREDSVATDYSKESFEIDLLSYVGSFISVNALRKVGPVNHRYFIYFDDTEHSLRLKRFGGIICVPDLSIVHDSNPPATDYEYITWNEYYLLRNRRHIICKYYPLVAIKLFRKSLGTIVKRQRDPYKLMVQSAYRDAYLGRLGKHKLYRPGFRVKKNAHN